MVDDFNSDELIKVMTEITNGGSEIFNSLKKGSDKYKEYPHYTRPEEVVIDNKKRVVPRVLLSGNHQKIKEWQKKHSLEFR